MEKLRILSGGNLLKSTSFSFWAFRDFEQNEQLANRARWLFNDGICLINFRLLESLPKKPIFGDSCFVTVDTKVFRVLVTWRPNFNKNAIEQNQNNTGRIFLKEKETEKLTFDLGFIGATSTYFLNSTSFFLYYTW